MASRGWSEAVEGGGGGVGGYLSTRGGKWGVEEDSEGKEDSGIFYVSSALFCAHDIPLRVISCYRIGGKTC